MSHILALSRRSITQETRFTYHSINMLKKISPQEVKALKFDPVDPVAREQSANIIAEVNNLNLHDFAYLIKILSFKNYKFHISPQSREIFEAV